MLLMTWGRGRRESLVYFALAAWALAMLGLCGCATARPSVADAHAGRSFDFERDTFAYANELVWVYGTNGQGRWAAHRREPKPQYAQHCFVVARSSVQFFENARFEPQQPLADEATYRRLIQRVATSNPRHPRPPERKIVIPGYADLREFSQAQEKLLKAECGSWTQSYTQRGHWRMIFPFSRHKEEQVAGQLTAAVGGHQPAVVHLVRFPRLLINHAVVIFAAHETPEEILFDAYDPNNPARPVTLTYNRGSRTFLLAQNNYFPGGRVDVYQIYHRWDY